MTAMAESRTLGPLTVLALQVVHAVQLLFPELAYAHAMDPERARVSRVQAFGRGGELAVSHLGTPWLAAPAGT